MSYFFIYAIGLTVVYIFYYTILIVKDLRSKNGQQSSSDVETFEVPTNNDADLATEVVEDGDGFSLTTAKDRQMATNKDEKQPEEVEVKSNEQEVSNELPEENAPTSVESSSAKPKEEIDEEAQIKVTIYKNMEETSPEYSVQVDSDEYRYALANRNKIPGNLIKVNQVRNEI